MMSSKVTAEEARGLAKTANKKYHKVVKLIVSAASSGEPGVTVPLINDIKIRERLNADHFNLHDTASKNTTWIFWGD